MLSTIVDLPVPRPPTSTFRLAQIGVEAHLRSVQTPPFPGQGEQLGVFLGLQLPVLGIEAYAGARIEECLPQTFDAHVRHLDPAGRGAVFEVVGLDDVPGVDGRDCKFLLRSIASTVVHVPVLDDLAQIVRQISYRSRNLNREEVLAPPRPNSGLPLQDHEHSTLVAGHVSSDGHPALFAHLLEDVREGHRREIRRRVRICDPERAEVASELVLLGVRRIETEDVHALARRQLEARKDMQGIPCCCRPKRRNAAHVIVIGDGEDRYAERQSLVDDGPRVRVDVARGGLPPERAAVVVRVHLKRTAVEHGAGGKRAGTGRVVARHCHSLLPWTISGRISALVVGEQGSLFRFDPMHFSCQASDFRPARYQARL